MVRVCLCLCVVVFINSILFDYWLFQISPIHWLMVHTSGVCAVEVCRYPSSFDIPWRHHTFALSPKKSDRNLNHSKNGWNINHIPLIISNDWTEGPRKRMCSVTNKPSIPVLAWLVPIWTFPRSSCHCAADIVQFVFWSFSTYRWFLGGFLKKNPKKLMCLFLFSSSLSFNHITSQIHPYRCHFRPIVSF